MASEINRPRAVYSNKYGRCIVKVVCNLYIYSQSTKKLDESYHFALNNRKEDGSGAGG